MSLNKQGLTTLFSNSYSELPMPQAFPQSYAVELSYIVWPFTVTLPNITPNYIDIWEYISTYFYQFVFTITLHFNRLFYNLSYNITFYSREIKFSLFTLTPIICGHTSFTRLFFFFYKKRYNLLNVAIVFECGQWKWFHRNREKEFQWNLPENMLVYILNLSLIDGEVLKP